MERRRVADRLHDLTELAMVHHSDHDRAQLNVKVCRCAADALEAMAEHIGTSRAAMLDALGHLMASDDARDTLSSCTE